VVIHVKIEHDYGGSEQSFNSRSTASTVDLGSFFLPPPAMRLDHAARAPPLSIRMWAGSFSLDGRIGEGRTPGGTQKVGGPHSASRKQATTKVVVRFLSSILFHPTDPTLPQCQHIQPSQPRRRGNNATTAPTTAQRQPRQHNDDHDSTTTTATAQRQL
jgi:hypothetical protein